jgi:hypothetical protein
MKRGDTLSFGVIWLSEIDRPLSLVGVTVRASLRGPDDAVRSLTVTILDAAAGEFEVSKPASATALFPLGRHEIDIKFDTGVRVVRTLSGTVHVDREVTP